MSPAADLPDDPETLFVWQVAVHADARGHGLAGRMLRGLLDRPACKDVKRLQTTITSNNAASWALFTRFAERIGATLESEARYRNEDHFDGRHKTEHMVTITRGSAMRAVA